MQEHQQSNALQRAAARAGALVALPPRGLRSLPAACRSRAALPIALRAVQSLYARVDHVPVLVKRPARRVAHSLHQ